MSPRRADPAAVVPDAEPRSYYDQPVLKQPVWTFEVPVYFAVGGMAGASSVVAAVARLADDEALARVAGRAAATGSLLSPLLLVSDLGRPERFHHMLRVLKPTSPMSVGSWVLAAYAPAAVVAALLTEVDRLPVVRRLAGGVAAALGPVLATYTAVLVADTAVPVWHEARRELPFVFAGSAVQSAASVALVGLPVGDARAPRTLLLAGNLLREGAALAMRRRLGAHGAPYHQGRAGWLHRASRGLSGAGLALALGAGRRSRAAASSAGALGLAGAVAERFAVIAAGSASAGDPAATVGPQRRRLDERSGVAAPHPMGSSAG